MSLLIIIAKYSLSEKRKCLNSNGEAQRLGDFLEINIVPPFAYPVKIVMSYV
jgi:hypothetical protein